MNRKLLTSIVSIFTLCLFMVVGCSSTPSNKSNEPYKQKPIYTYVIHYNTELVNDTIYTYERISGYIEYADKDYFDIEDVKGYVQWFNKMNVTKVERIP